MDKIHIKDLRFHGHHGVLAEETALGQPFLVTLTLEADLRAAGASDDLDRGVDYRQAIAAAREIVEGPPVRLLETLAERIAARVLQTCGAVSAVTVRAGKPAPPVAEVCSGIFVEIRRARNEV